MRHGPLCRQSCAFTKFGMRLTKLPILSGLLALVLTVALASWGFGHRFASASDAAAETYAEVYGLSAGDLCADPSDGHADKDCDACRLLTGFHLADPDIGFDRYALSPSAAARDLSDPLLACHTRDATQPVRAPPLA